MKPKDKPDVSKSQKNIPPYMEALLFYKKRPYLTKRRHGPGKNN